MSSLNVCFQLIIVRDEGSPDVTVQPSVTCDICRLNVNETHRGCKESST